MLPFGAKLAQLESTVDLRSTRVDVEPRSFQKLFDPSPIRHRVRQRMIGDSGRHGRSRPERDFLGELSLIVDKFRGKGSTESVSCH
jgi:hypothetical protein